MMCAALAVWVSFGVTTFANDEARGTRIGLLPSLAWLIAFLGVSLILWAVLKPEPRRVAPLWLSAILLVPWLPLRLPDSAFLWTGALRWWVWTAIITALAVPTVGRWLRRRRREWITTPHRAMIVAFSVAVLAYTAGAWAVAPRLPAGDEPHYLVITQSILTDHDLQIENNHQRGDYRSYFGGVLKPDYLRRGTNRQIYSIHAPGLPLIVAPAFALFGYHGVEAALLLVSAGATALAWLLAWRVTHDLAASWFAWGAVAFSTPFFFHTFAVYPDALCAGLLLVGMLALVDARWLEPKRLAVIGAALACLPWLHTRFALISVAVSIVIVGRLFAVSGRGARLLGLFALPALSAVVLFAFYQSIYGTPNPAAPYGGATQSAPANLLRGIPGLLFDEQFGLLPNAPVYACALAGFVVMLRRGHRRLALELLFICALYAFTVAEFQMWWAGYSAAARFLVPLMLVLAIPMAIWFAGLKSVSARLMGGGALLLSLVITFTLAAVDRGLVLFNFRDGAWQVGLWLSPVVNLTTALPSLFTTTPSAATVNAAVWLAAAALTLGAALSLERLGLGTSGLVVAIGALAAAGSMASASIVWRHNGVRPITPTSGGLALLKRYDPDAGQVALSYRPYRRLSTADAPKALTLAAVEPSNLLPGEALIFLSHAPAGLYALDGTSNATSGTVRVATDRATPPLEEWPVASLGRTWRRVISLPVGLDGVRVDADDTARVLLGSLTLKPLEVPPLRERPAGGQEASSGARYGPTTVYVISGRVYLEPGGLWVGGSQRAGLVVSGGGRPVIRLFLRNPPADNQVTVTSGKWRQELVLRSGEERAIEVPAGENRLGVLIEVAVSSGARPVNFEPGSKDERFLGLWIEPR